MTCKGCTLRHINCHASCEVYKEYKAKNEARAEARSVDRFIKGYVTDRIEKVRRRMGRNKACR